MQNFPFVHFSVERGEFAISLRGGKQEKTRGAQAVGQPGGEELCSSRCFSSGSWLEWASERLFLAMAISFLTFPLG